LWAPTQTLGCYNTHGVNFILLYPKGPPQAVPKTLLSHLLNENSFQNQTKVSQECNEALKAGIGPVFFLVDSTL